MDWSELLASQSKVSVTEAWGQFWNQEAAERPLLEAVTQTTDEDTRLKILKYV
jgi:hypothetical protein